MFKKIGVMTSGGDSPGMNPAVRAVVRTAASHGVKVVGIRNGYEGLFSGDLVSLDDRAMSAILERGGPFFNRVGVSNSTPRKAAPKLSKTSVLTAWGDSS